MNIDKKYLHPTYEAGRDLALKNIQGSIVNLNLIRLKEIADYSDFPKIAPVSKISGYDAFMQYIQLAKPFVEQGGGEILFIGKGDHFLIGPQDEQWHICMLIRQKSVSDFFAFEQNPGYMQIVGHRSAAILDSRLLPLEIALL
ncbi:DUF1330 domain-containing protein [Sphingobacterium detergens]|uniref:DUF1330 domain-containing protein n=1 Tax=Sphingobacterium detergens TaxID=1145106 RepID=A0A420BF30_SPHD1|nr:DUF1330 domain-containing protein [Sphingobacterium detergens]RKE55306.1 hypothetical protein DFQ12_0137 [Sphingobacterium detergens]